MNKIQVRRLFLCAVALAAPAFADFTPEENAKAQAYCKGGQFTGVTVFVEDQSQASSKAKIEIVNNIISQVESQIDMGSSSREKNGILEESSSYLATSQIKSDLVLIGFQEIGTPKRLENGLYEYKGYVCNSNAAKPYLDSLNRYLKDSLQVFLKQEIDEDICVSASKARNKMLGWQRILETLNQVDKNLQGKYIDAIGKIEKDCSEISKRQTIAVIANGTEPKGSNALKNLEQYMEEYLVNSSLYSTVAEGHEAKFKCEVEIAQNYSIYTLRAKILNTKTGKIVHNRMVNVESNLKTSVEHKKASMELVSKLLKRCGTMSVGETYEGECKNGKRDGKGKLTYLSGDVYEGYWKDDMFNGQGKFIDRYGIYEGEFKNGQQNGKGKLIYANGNIYEGEFKDGQFNGKGKIIFAQGGFYEGGWKNGQWDGKGKVIYSDGNVYEGEFKDGQFNGKGKIIFAQGGFYEGEFKEGTYHGKGKLATSNGDVYEGEFKEGAYHGKGKLLTSDGEVYEGELVNGRSDGKGKLLTSNGEVFEGEWKNGFYVKGKYTYNNGDAYEGEFKNGRASGKGKIIYKNGDVFEGEFVNGEYVKGKHIYKNGDVYEGDFKNNLFEGKGKLTYKNGNVLEGEFRKGEFYGKVASKKGGSFKDARDGKEYRTVEIGTQTWMAENLNYNASGSLCYNNDPANCKKYGRLYNWETAKKACPAGWHLPSKDEWRALANSVSNTATAGAKLKAGNGWNSYQGNSGNGSDDYDFSALPGGAVNGGGGGSSNIGISSAWWTSTERDNNNAWPSIINSDSDMLALIIDIPKLSGLSVRCLKD